MEINAKMMVCLAGTPYTPDKVQEDDLLNGWRVFIRDLKIIKSKTPGEFERGFQ